MATEAGEITKLGKCLLCKHEDLGSKHGTTKSQLIRKQTATPQKPEATSSASLEQEGYDIRWTTGLGRWSGPFTRGPDPRRQRAAGADWDPGDVQNWGGYYV